MSNQERIETMINEYERLAHETLYTEDQSGLDGLLVASQIYSQLLQAWAGGKSVDQFMNENSELIDQLSDALGL